MIDDSLDYCSDAKTLGKNVGDDLADGKATLPVIHALKHGTPAQQIKIRDSLTQGTLKYLPEVMVAIAETNAIEYTREVAETEVSKAIAALDVLADSPYKDALIDIARYSIERNF